MFNRKQYMANECSHDEYYSQFVNQGILQTVRSVIGTDRIAKSKDKHFSDIPLYEWDMLHNRIIMQIDVNLFKELNNATYAAEYRDSFIISLSDTVCIAKQAAKIIRESNAVLT